MFAAPLFAGSPALRRTARHRTRPRVPRLAGNILRATTTLAFAVAGTMFLRLTISATIAVPLAGRQGIAVSAADLATAAQLGSIWWVLVAGVVVSFGAALLAFGTLMERLGDASGT